MHIGKLFEQKEVVYSFEIFPPKPTSPIETVYNTIEALADLGPDFISVTYGAGGNLKDNKTIELSSYVKNKYGIETLAHLTCIGSSKDAVDDTLRRLRSLNIENILALRGDIPKNDSTKGDFNFADELIRYIASKGGYGIAAACYPEGHIENKDIAQNIEVLKRKSESGAEHFISQLFFNNEYFYDLLNQVEQADIDIPIQAGIMPVINKRQIERVVSLCGATLPPKFLRIMDKYEHNSDALRDAGIAYALEQIIDLISSGVRGIHLYTMNNPYVARKITEGVTSVVDYINDREVVS